MDRSLPANARDTGSIPFPERSYHLNEKFIQLKPHLKKKSIVWSLTHLTHSANNATLVSGYWESKVLYFLDG